MIIVKRSVILLVTALVIAPGAAFSQEESIGERDFNENCAICHGKDGKGGPFAEFLKHNVRPLTTLRKDNKGIFPFERIYKVIDGRIAVKGHGSAEMPIWGSEFKAASVGTHGPFFGEFYSEDITRARILALIEYINRLQE